MFFDKNQEDLVDFLYIHDVAALATIKTLGVAHATAIFYHVEPDLNFYFLTKNSTNKIDNIKNNSSVALVVADTQSLQTVQVEGVATLVDYADNAYSKILEKFTQDLAKKGREWDNLPINKISQGFYSFVKITPTWVKWSDFKNKGNVVQFEQVLG